MKTFRFSNVSFQCDFCVFLRRSPVKAYTKLLYQCNLITFQDFTDSDGEISNYYLQSFPTPQTLSQVIVFLTVTLT